jgi:hypothetical protein
LITFASSVINKIMSTSDETAVEAERDSADREALSQLHPPSCSATAKSSSGASMMPFETKTRKPNTLQRSRNPIIPSISPYPAPLGLFRNITPPTALQASISPVSAVSPKPPVRRESSEVIERRETEEYPQNAILIPRLPRKQVTTIALESGVKRKNTIVKAREQVVKKYVFGIERSTSESQSTTEGQDQQCFSSEDRRISSLTLMSNYASRAQGERCTGRSDQPTTNIPPRTLRVKFSVVAEEDIRSPAALSNAAYPISNEPLAEDEDVPSAPPRYRQQQQESPNRSWSFHRVLRSFASLNRHRRSESSSDEASQSSRATARSFLSATWLVVLPTRRSASTVQPIEVKRVRDQQQLDRKKMASVALGTCGCVMLVATFVILWIIAASKANEMEGSTPTMAPSAVNDLTKSPAYQNDGIAVPGKPTVSTMRPRQLESSTLEPGS